MLGRVAVPLALLALLLSISPTHAGTTYKVLGRASLGSLSAGGPVGDAFIHQLNGSSHVTVRGTGLVPGSQPVWRMHTNDTCAAQGPVLITSSPMTVTQAGTTLSVLADGPVVPIGTTTPTFIAIRLYDSAQGPELVCGRVFDMPFSIVNSAHWW
jgi:hypothetical protein